MKLPKGMKQIGTLYGITMCTDKKKNDSNTNICAIWVPPMLAEWILAQQKKIEQLEKELGKYDLHQLEKLITIK